MQKEDHHLLVALCFLYNKLGFGQESLKNEAKNLERTGGAFRNDKLGRG